MGAAGERGRDGGSSCSGAWVRAEGDAHSLDGGRLEGLRRGSLQQDGSGQGLDGDSKGGQGWPGRIGKRRGRRGMRPAIIRVGGSSGELETGITTPAVSVR